MQQTQKKLRFISTSFLVSAKLHTEVKPNFTHNFLFKIVDHSFESDANVLIVCEWVSAYLNCIYPRSKINHIIIANVRDNVVFPHVTINEIYAIPTTTKIININQALGKPLYLRLLVNDGLRYSSAWLKTKRDTLSGVLRSLRHSGQNIPPIRAFHLSSTNENVFQEIDRSPHWEKYEREEE